MERTEGLVQRRKQAKPENEVVDQVEKVNLFENFCNLGLY